MKPKILVTRQVFPEVVARLAQHFEIDHNASDDIMSPDLLRRRADGCTGVIRFLTEEIDAAFLDACPTAKFGSNIALGYNHIDIAQLTKRGVGATNTPGGL